MLPPIADIRYDDCYHSYLISEADLEDYDLSCEDLASIPKWPQSTIQAAGDLVNDPLDPRRTTY